VNQEHPLLSSGTISRWQACDRRDGAAPKAAFRWARAHAHAPYLSLFPSLSRARSTATTLAPERAAPRAIRQLFGMDPAPCSPVKAMRCPRG